MKHFRWESWLGEKIKNKILSFFLWNFLILDVSIMRLQSTGHITNSFTRYCNLLRPKLWTEKESNGYTEIFRRVWKVYPQCVDVTYLLLFIDVGCTKFFSSFITFYWIIRTVYSSHQFTNGNKNNLPYLFIKSKNT